ncbi:MAG: porin family protein [Candidatus Symbiothrix sp.]|jgi:hypothetical protein|nr:porin family protein [Candidatus Symbiothrix sp.]
MKKVLFIFFLLTLIVSFAKAQDIITLKSGDDVRAKVTEIGTSEVKYKQFSNLSGPTYTIRKSEIFRIKYENGEVEIFDREPEETSDPVRTVPDTRRPASPAVRRPQRQEPLRQQQSRPLRQERIVEESTQEFEDEDYSKGYIGLSVGAAYLSDDMGAFGTGTQVAVNFGYLFSPHVGIGSSIFVTDFPVSSGGVTLNDVTIGLSGVVAGPLFSTPANESRKVEIDFRPAIGLARGQITVGSDSGTSDEVAFVFSAGAVLHINLSRHFSLSVHADYFNGKAEGIDLSSFGLSLGANYRF